MVIIIDHEHQAIGKRAGIGYLAILRGVPEEGGVAVAGVAEDGVGVPDEEIALIVLPEDGDLIGDLAAMLVEIDEVQAIVPGQAIEGGDPEEAFGIFVNAEDLGGYEAVLLPQGAEADAT